MKRSIVSRSLLIFIFLFIPSQLRAQNDACQWKDKVKQWAHEHPVAYSAAFITGTFVLSFAAGVAYTKLFIPDLLYANFMKYDHPMQIVHKFIACSSVVATVYGINKSYFAQIYKELLQKL